MIHDLKKYKTAKILVRDLKNILRIMMEYETRLNTFKKYTPIQKLLHNLVENKKYIIYHLNKQTVILKNKGHEEEHTKH